MEKKETLSCLQPRQYSRIFQEKTKKYQRQNETKTQIL